MTYPRNPGDILKELREERGKSAAQMGLLLMHKAGWPKSRWDNLEKGGQLFEPEYVLDLVKADLMATTDPCHKTCYEESSDAGQHGGLTT